MLLGLIINRGSHGDATTPGTAKPQGSEVTFSTDAVASDFSWILCPDVIYFTTASEVRPGVTLPVRHRRVVFRPLAGFFYLTSTPAVSTPDHRGVTEAQRQYGWNCTGARKLCG